MRITPILLFIGCLQVSARVLAQTISLSEKNTPLQKVFKHIEQQSGYVFFFDYAWLEKARPVTLVIKDIPLTTALDLVFSNQPLKYSIAGKNIVVQLKAVPAGKPGSLRESPAKPHTRNRKFPRITAPSASTSTFQFSTGNYSTRVTQRRRIERANPRSNYATSKIMSPAMCA